MKKIVFSLFLLLFLVQITVAQNTSEKQEIIELSKTKWQWMADKDADKLAELFDDQSVFVHMGGSWGKEREVNIIRSGGIWYKKADIHEVSVEIIDNTAILLNRITLVAEVGGNEVTNPFEVTEVYIKKADGWKLGSLSFTRLMTP
ncbi:nuclear transport factor 2 family protein [Algoriphagus faecimaris]|nr:nuclear transport factor 2 family protein [Algoriphagus faecimaris]